MSLFDRLIKDVAREMADSFVQEDEDLISEKNS